MCVSVCVCCIVCILILGVERWPGTHVNMSRNSGVSDQVLDVFQKPLYLYLSRGRESPCFCVLVFVSLCLSLYIYLLIIIYLLPIYYMHICMHVMLLMLYGCFFFIPRKQYHLESFFTLSTFLLFIFCGTSIIWYIYDQFSQESCWRSPQALQSPLFL